MIKIDMEISPEIQALQDPWDEPYPIPATPNPNDWDGLFSGSSFEPPRCDDPRILEKVVRVREILPLQVSFSLRADGNLEFNNVVLNPDWEVPSNVGFKGGVAREIMRAVISLNDYLSEVRDCDLIAVEGTDPEILRKLAKTWMTEDLTNGYGVEIIQNNPNFYLHSRDFTINEVFWLNDSLIASPDCVLDTLQGILRPTEFESNRYSCLNDKLLAKMYRFIAEAELRGESLKIEGVDPNLLIQPFHIALHLDRALGRSPEIAEIYLRLLAEKNHLPKSVGTPADLSKVIEWLAEDLFSGTDFFRNYQTTETSPKEKRGGKDMEFQRRSEEWLEEYDGGPAREGMGKRTFVKKLRFSNI